MSEASRSTFEAAHRMEPIYLMVHYAHPGHFVFATGQKGSVMREGYHMYDYNRTHKVALKHLPEGTRRIPWFWTVDLHAHLQAHASPETQALLGYIRYNFEGSTAITYDYNPCLFLGARVGGRPYLAEGIPYWLELVATRKLQCEGIREISTTLDANRYRAEQLSAERGVGLPINQSETTERWMQGLSGGIRFYLNGLLRS